MRILVTGGRDFHYKDIVYGALNKAHRKRGVTCVIHHNMGGADYISAEWAKDNGVDVYVCNARPKDGSPDACIAFGITPSGLNVPVWEVKPTTSQDKP